MATDSTVTSPRGSGRAAGVYRVVVLHPPSPARAGQSAVLEGGVLISRETDAGEERLVLDDAEVSRKHARFERDADGNWLLRDQGSHNGSFVNGRGIREQRLAPGDVSRVGQRVLLVQYLDLPASQRLSRRRLADSPNGSPRNLPPGAMSSSARKIASASGPRSSNRRALRRARKFPTVSTTLLVAMPSPKNGSANAWPRISATVRM